MLANSIYRPGIAVLLFIKAATRVPKKYRETQMYIEYTNKKYLHAYSLEETCIYHAVVEMRLITNYLVIIGGYGGIA